VGFVRERKRCLFLPSTKPQRSGRHRRGLRGQISLVRQQLEGCIVICLADKHFARSAHADQSCSSAPPGRISLTVIARDAIAPKKAADDLSIDLVRRNRRDDRHEQSVREPSAFQILSKPRPSVGAEAQARNEKAPLCGAFSVWAVLGSNQ
jgi:hypothetical protein